MNFFAIISFTQPIIPSTFISFPLFVSNVIQVLLLIAGILAIISLIIAGIQYISAGGDPTKTSAARQGIVNTIIGIVVIIIAFSLISWVISAITSGRLL